MKKLLFLTIIIFLTTACSNQNMVELGAGGATCTYSGSGDWNIDCSDNCSIDDKYVDGDLNLIYDSAGALNLTGTLSVDALNVGNGCKINAKTGSAIIKIY